MACSLQGSCQNVTGIVLDLETWPGGGRTRGLEGLQQRFVVIAFKRGIQETGERIRIGLGE